MIKVRNKKILRMLAGKAYRRNFRQNLMMIFSIAMTAFLITVVFSLGISYYKTVTERNLASAGMKYDVALPEPADEQVQKAREADGVKCAGLAVKCAVAGSDDSTDRIRFYWADEICWEQQCQPAFVGWKGSYPEKENEIMLSLQALSELGIKQPETRMEIPLTWSSLSADSDLNDCKTVFYLTGWFEEYGSHNNGYVSKSFCEKTGVKQTDIANGVLYLSLENPLYSNAYIKKLGEQIGLIGNQVIYSDTLLLVKFIRLAAGILFLTIMTLVSGALFVYNIFYISVAREIRHYGQYKTIGMTVSQMKMYLMWQIVWNILPGISAGLLLGSVVARQMVPHMLGALSGGTGMQQAAVFHPILLLLASAFTLLAVWSGCRQLLKKTARLTPIEAVRFNESVQKRKTERRTKEIGMFQMARRNIFRSRKRFMVSAASLCMVIIVFLVVSVILQQSSAKAILNRQYQYDARILNSKLRDDQEHAGITEELAEQVSELDGVKTVRKVYSQEVQYDYADTYKIMKDYMGAVYDLPIMSEGQLEENLEVWKNRPPGDETYPGQGQGRLVGISEAEFDALNEQGGGNLDKEAFFRGEGAIAFGFLSVSAKSLVRKKLNFQVYGQPQKSSVEVTWSGDGIQTPVFFTNDVLPDIVVCEELFRELVDVPILELLDIDYEKAFDTTADQAISEILVNHDDLTLSTKTEDYNLLYENELRLRVIGGSLCAVLVILTFLNYGNMMAVSIQSRRRELAMMQSIGMTCSQQKIMMAAEGFHYALIACGVSLTAGFPLSWLISAAVNTYHTPYQPSILPNLLFFAMLFAFCCLIPIVLYQFLLKGRLIELLRE